MSLQDAVWLKPSRDIACRTADEVSFVCCSCANSCCTVPYCDLL